MLNGKKKNVSHQEEKYQFIREQIRPQRKKKILVWLGRFIMIAAMACIFGMIAGTIILYMQKQSRETQETADGSDVLYSASPIPTADPAHVQSDEVRKAEISLKRMNRLSERMAAIGEEAGSAIVSVEVRDNVQNFLKQDIKDGRESVFGIIVRETKNYFYIITTCDILKGQPSVNVRLEHDILIEASVLGNDPQINLAAIRVKKSEISRSALSKLTVAKFGDGQDLKKGTNIVAIGCPNGILNSVVTGSVTNNKIYAPVMDSEVELLTTDILYSAEGNGVVMNLNSEIVGFITTEFLEMTGTAGVSFLNISSISAMLDNLQRTNKKSFIGCEGRSISKEMAASHHMAAGAYITDVYSDYPAYAGGMRIADVITKFDGQPIHRMSEIYQIIARHKKGDVLRCTVWRKSGSTATTKELQIKLG